MRNKAKPKGSIAEAHVVNEALIFCSMYLGSIETKFNRSERNDDKGKNRQECVLSIFSQKACPLGVSKLIHLPENEFRKAYWYILNNCEYLQPYLDDHKEDLELESPTNISERQERQFPEWFKNRVQEDDYESSQFHRVDVSVEEISVGVIADIEKQKINDEIFDIEDEDETLKDYCSDNQESILNDYNSDDD
ncbi:hypothetical protein Ddye_000733 [Dipteronia dyeriana]|uniref:DUF4218 domain-containing protein n=1 Tax=Dipteronia dyeriana TaxID=168575 RepID=A0AAD9XMA0_9ROSI|nr:hypothetical protein Ddye_000733 [Dipteronia dyeriana]